ncbi:hypothetical protein, conserved [Plasmodium gonderi]|uniref:Uncharacterized protein n=1 Tax=Plasmodium gonderi TaxID=77519 RepID=A0A1Y1JMS6_PLAGO|nr:hypothetical protein, conserved [Plasmodium gonderi]GAW82775.1 hypothetical protein, conserved [Plasmodium gonderi]
MKWDWTRHDRVARRKKVRKKLVKPKMNNNEQEKNLFSSSSGDDMKRRKMREIIAPQKKRNFFSGNNEKDKDIPEGNDVKNKKRKLKRNCIISSSSDNSNHISSSSDNSNHISSSSDNSNHISRTNKSEKCKSEERNPHEKDEKCLFSNHSEEGNKEDGKRSTRGKYPKCLFSSSSDEKSKNTKSLESYNRLCTKETIVHPNFSEKKKKKKRLKKITTFMNYDTEPRDTDGEENKSGSVKGMDRCKSINKFQDEKNKDYTVEVMQSNLNENGRKGVANYPDGNKIYNKYEKRKEAIYRLINFEKLKKRASRKLNFMSIVDITKEENDSPSSPHLCTYSTSREEKKESVNNSEDDILNQTGISYELSNESTYSNEHNNAIAMKEKNNNRTIDIYNYYYLDRNKNESGILRDVEKIVDTRSCSGEENLYERLFGEMSNFSKGRWVNSLQLSDSVRSDSDVIEASKKSMKKRKKSILQERKSLKMNPIKMNREKCNMVMRNLMLYRNFKNINVELSRQNNLKGLNFKKMVSNFIRVINKNIWEMNEQGDMNMVEKMNNLRNSLENTSDVEERLLTPDHKTNGEEETVALFGEDVNVEEKHSQLGKAKCVCIFCVENNKILTNEELYVSTFKYMEERKKEDTVIKPFFMNNYVFTAFINYSIHYENVKNVHKMENAQKMKNSQFYKFNRDIKKKYNIKKAIHFVAKKVTLTSIGIHIEGSNFLKEDENFIVVINFIKWKIIRKSYEEILKLKKKKKEKENLSIFKKFFFFIKAIDEYCTLCNIRVDHQQPRSNFREKKKNFINHSIYKQNDHSSGSNSKFFGPSYFSYNEIKVNQIEESLNIDLVTSNVQFVLVDSLHVYASDTFYLYPAHVIVLF